MEQLHAWVGSQGEDITAWQMSLRGVAIFLAGLILVRLASTRAFGRWNALDIILAVIVGSNLSRALTGSAPFAPTLVATFVLVLLHALLARAVVRWPALSRLAKGRAVRLVEDGRLDPAALRRHGLGPGDLESALRAAGHEDLTGVRSVWLERNGDITVIARKETGA